MPPLANSCLLLPALATSASTPFHATSFLPPCLFLSLLVCLSLRAVALPLAFCLSAESKSSISCVWPNRDTSSFPRILCLMESFARIFGHKSYVARRHRGSSIDCCRNYICVSRIKNITLHLTDYYITINMLQDWIGLMRGICMKYHVFRLLLLYSWYLYFHHYLIYANLNSTKLVYLQIFLIYSRLLSYVLGISRICVSFANVFKFCR